MSAKRGQRYALCGLVAAVLVCAIALSLAPTSSWANEQGGSTDAAMSTPLASDTSKSSVLDTQGVSTGGEDAQSSSHEPVAPGVEQPSPEQPFGLVPQDDELPRAYAESAAAADGDEGSPHNGSSSPDGGAIAVPDSGQTDVGTSVSDDGTRSHYEGARIPNGRASLGDELLACASEEMTTIKLKVTFGQDEARKSLDLVNAFRTGNEAWWYAGEYGGEKVYAKGLGKLTYDYDLERIAMQRAYETAVLFGHVCPNGLWCDELVPLKFWSTGENIAAYRSTAKEVIEAFKENKYGYDGQGHRRNMLSEYYNAIGVGHVVVDGVHYWAQEFGYSDDLNTKKTTADNSTREVKVSLLNEAIVGSPSVKASPNSFLLEKVGSSVSLPSVTAKSLSLSIGYYDTLKPFDAVADATWTSDDESVVEVRSGKIVAKAKGSTKIRCVAFGKAITVPVYVAVTPSWSGASKIPVKANAGFSVTNGGWIRLKVNGKNATTDGVVSISGKTVTGLKAGTSTIYLLDPNGKQVASKKVSVYAITGADYELQSSLDKSLVLDIQGKSKENSARMLVYERNGGKNQRFRFEAMSDGTYLIKCVHSGKYVDVQGGGTKKSQAVIQYTKNSKDNQRWQISVDASNRVTFTCKKSGMCFDIQGGKAKKGAKMIQYPSNGGKNQKWVLNKK